jgi:Protein of unknown function (DUF1588)/Protein of unknown function (DUF1592)/Protein of unknown function (DUF1595)/Protein of unknown function (DUF1587)/Protein of unknown function (DUF1585)
MRTIGLSTTALAICLTACNGAPSSPAGSGAGGPGGATATGGQSGASGAATLAACAAESPSTIIPARVRRLSQSEFAHSLEQLLAAPPVVTVDFPVDPLSGGYDTNANDLRVTSLLANTLFDVVPALAAQAVAKMAPCDASACASQLLGDFARRAYRRAPSAQELSELAGVYEAARAASDAPTALTRAVSVILQSPDFLYATELGSPDATGKVVTLLPHELATQLAFLVTGMPPDAELSAAAENGALSGPDGREAQARRLLKTPGARAVWGTFAAQWFELSEIDKLEKDATAFPAWKSERPRLVTDAQSFFAGHVLDQNASLPDLLNAGLLTQQAFLARHAQSLDDSPVQRGHFVRVRMLCQDIPPPPPTLKITLPPPDPTSTTRERIVAHTASETCQGCHAKMNPIGFAFEGFDAMGRPRTTDNGKPVDTSGELVGTDVDGTFSSPEELATKLGQSASARECFARQWFQFASGMPLGTESARTALAKEAEPFVKGSQSVAELTISLLRSDIFSTRCRVED